MTFFTQILASFLQLLFQKVLLDQTNSQTQHCIVLNLIMIADFLLKKKKVNVNTYGRTRC